MGRGKLGPPANGVYLGIWADPDLGNNQEQSIEIREGPPPNGINHPFRLHLVYYQWTDIEGMLNKKGILQPDGVLSGDIAHGRVPVITWGCDNSVAGSDHVVAGGDPTEDAVITATANALKQYPGPVLLRWFWEFNVFTKNQSCRGDSGGAPTQQVYADFIAAWQHIWTLFQQAGATNVTFLWNPGNYTSGGNDDPHGFYPGNGYVDWIGVEVYQRASTSSFPADFGQFYSDFSQGQYGGKPLMVGESGSLNYSQNQLETQSP